MAEAAGRRGRAGASRSSRSRPTRRRSSTRPRSTACSRRSSSPRAARPRSAQPIARVAVGAGRPAAAAAPRRRAPRRAPPPRRGAVAARRRRPRRPARERDAGRAAARGRARRRSSTALAAPGPGGRIVARRRARDGAAAAARRAAGDGPRSTLTATQRTIAQRMTESRVARSPSSRSRPRSTWRPLAALREELRALGREPLPSFNDLVVRRSRSRCASFPALNAAYDGRPDAPARARQRRHRRRHRRRAARADDLRRRPAVGLRDRRRVAARWREARAGAHARAGRPRRRHLHRLQPRHVRRAPLPRGDQPSRRRRSSRSARSRGAPVVAADGAIVARHD